MKQSLFLALATVHAVSTLALVYTIVSDARPGRVVTYNAAQQADRVPILVELPVPEALRQPATWTFPSALRSFPDTSTDLMNALDAIVPSFPSSSLFRKDRRAIPIWEVLGDGPEPKRVVPVRYIACGTLPAGVDLPKGESMRSYINAELTLFEPAKSASGDELTNVAAEIGVARLPGTGSHVLAAIVDRGFNRAHRAPGSACDKEDNGPCFDDEVSLPPMEAGHIGSNNTHGAMVAYDVTIAAPDVTLADLVLSQGTSRLCDAIEIFGHLTAQMNNLMSRYHGVVVVNAWQVVDPLAPGSAEYINNAKHPLNVAVKSLADVGADIVFAAGNCGPEPYPVCKEKGETIYGANSHPHVLTIGATSFTSPTTVTAYSARGPGQSHLAAQKPDLVAFTDFKGSKSLGDLDTGTSAAAALAAGIVAAYRSAQPYDTQDRATYPGSLRQLLKDRSEPCGGIKSHSLDTGWGRISAPCPQP